MKTKTIRRVSLNRAEVREILARAIEKETGLPIDPSRVRLHAEHGGAWTDVEIER